MILSPCIAQEGTSSSLQSNRVIVLFHISISISRGFALLFSLSPHFFSFESRGQSSACKMVTKHHFGSRLGLRPTSMCTLYNICVASYGIRIPITSLKKTTNYVVKQYFSVTASQTLFYFLNFYLFKNVHF